MFRDILWMIIVPFIWKLIHMLNSLPTRLPATFSLLRFTILTQVRLGRKQNVNR